MKYYTRFAPSPTGMLHVGGVRTAIFNYLAAKSSDGKFSLRIEDTDRERFVEGAVDAIHEGLTWLSLKHDGEVVYQSDRLPVYQKYADELVKKGMAYKCFCTSERLAALKDEQIAAKKPPVYDRCCLNLTEQEVAEKEAAGEKYVIRFKIPTKPAEISWIDKVRGEVRFQTDTLEDFILIKSDSWPTYNFANVIDDHEQGFNLIIRGDEFVPSTPKHILLYLALGWDHPEFAHVPVIVGPDMKKLSKRNGDTAISEYMQKGYLPEALVNFLVFLGWNPGTTEEIFSLSELEKVFTVDRIGSSPAVFDIERLNYLNGVYIRKLTVAELTNRLIDFDTHSQAVIPGGKPGISLSEVDRKLLEKVVTVEQSRLKTLAEFSEITKFYFQAPKEASDILVFKKSSPEATQKGLEAVVETLTSLDDSEYTKMTADDFFELLKDIVAKNNLNNADVFWPVRVALSGEEKSPSPNELLWVFGREEALKRIQKYL